MMHDNAYTVAADINTIEEIHQGTVTVQQITSHLTGDSCRFAAAFADVDTFSGTPTATLRDADTLAELKAINNAIDGTITLTAMASVVMI